MYRIERAAITDAEEILQLQRLAYRSEAILYDDWTIPPLTQTREEIEKEFQCATFLKACAGGLIIGAVRGALHDGACAVGRLMVHPEHQRRGVGGRLLSSMEKEFPSANSFELFTGSLSEGNIRLYERHGYRAFRTERLTPRVELVFMKKAGRK